MLRTSRPIIIVCSILAVIFLFSGVVGRSEVLGSEKRSPASVGSHADSVENRLDRLVDAQSFSGGLGVNIHFVGHHAGEVAKIAQSGFRLVRSDLLWAHVERARGHYDWHQYDSLVADLRANHLVPVMILAYSNALYAQRVLQHPNSDSLGFQAPSQGSARVAYMAFVRAAAERYGSDVIWEIWNEPDHNFGDPVDLRGFVSFALEACRSIRTVAPDAPVIGPAASGFVWWFLRALREADSNGCFDAISVHPYRDEPPESVLRDWARAHEMMTSCLPTQRCPALVDSEWGYAVIGGAWTAQRQADFDTRLRLLDMIAGVKLTIIYDWQNDGPDPRDKEANFGLLDFQGTPKPAWRALSGMSRDLAGLHYIKSIETNRFGNFVMSFERDATARKVVVWSTTGDGALLSLSALLCRGNASTPTQGGCNTASPPVRQVSLSSSPTVISLDVAAKADGSRTTTGIQQSLPNGSK